jgi:hypothetical protein
MKLLSMTDFVLECRLKMENNAQNHVIFSTSGNLSKIFNYASFLKQPLKLEMFIPCDEDGNVLEEPNIDNSPFCSVNGENYDYDVLKYQQAKENVLFEDFEIETNREGEKVIVGDYTCLKIKDLGNFTIEDLVKYVYIKLTESAIKQFKKK